MWLAESGAIALQPQKITTASWMVWKHKGETAQRELRPREWVGGGERKEGRRWIKRLAAFRFRENVDSGTIVKDTVGNGAAAWRTCGDKLQGRWLYRKP